MKKIILALALVMAAAVGFATEPFGIDYEIDVAAVTSTGIVGFATAVQPTYLGMTGVLPAASTVSVYRVHAGVAKALTAITNAAGVGGQFISTGIWLMPGDSLHIIGATNATFEVQGNQ